MDVTVVIRCAGEKTESLCHELIKKQVPENQVFPIWERPFFKAVDTTFDLGIREGKTWTLAVDADVLIRSGAIAGMLQRAAKMPQDIYVYQDLLLDKLFLKSRRVGLHLYKTAVLAEAKSFLNHDPLILRPESATYKKMDEIGLKHYKGDHIVGLHDYHQYNHDYIRKGFMQQVKNNSIYLNDYLLKKWTEHVLNGEIDYANILRGWLSGMNHNQEVNLDIAFFEKLLINEKRDLGKLEMGDIDAIMGEVDQLCEVEGSVIKRRSGTFRAFKKRFANLLIKAGNRIFEEA